MYEIVNCINTETYYWFFSSAAQCFAAFLALLWIAYMRFIDTNLKIYREINEYISKNSDAIVAAKGLSDYVNDRGVLRYRDIAVKISESKEIVKRNSGLSKLQIEKEIRILNECERHLSLSKSYKNGLRRARRAMILVSVSSIVAIILNLIYLIISDDINYLIWHNILIGYGLIILLMAMLTGILGTAYLLWSTVTENIFIGGPWGHERGRKLYYSRPLLMRFQEIISGFWRQKGKGESGGE